MPRTVVVIALLLVACGEADAPDCGFEDGTYLAMYERLNGDCPDLEDKLVVPGSFPPECTQTVRYDAQCGVTTVRDCNVDGDRARVMLSLTERGAGYEGQAQYTLLGRTVHRAQAVPSDLHRPIER
jgi:hypothetical protein